MRSFVTVSRETEARLDAFAAHLRRWTRAKNLVGPDTLKNLWTRHIADSAQVVALMPEARRWVDLGAGAGFPGLVVASLVCGDLGSRVDLVESNGRKCAFLRSAARETGVPATVHCDRIERFATDWSGAADVVTARALAPLVKLLDLTAPLIQKGCVGVFHKGQDVERELTEASTYWTFAHELVSSRTPGGGALVIVRDCERKSA
ncbi:16S rRNA (guanine(527)-N(7))-methyltransferase RsmG [Microbaculum marinum]|uniref:Ribosomal RNA small subunit methyltransferase G n=1 Tax=Microbaculum marinum TaxID=1764581 RepID=A0AAW9RRG1_9HYPH